jgi:hypothetical protein
MLVGPEGGSQLIGCSFVVQFAEQRRRRGGGGGLAQDHSRAGHVVIAEAGSSGAARFHGIKRWSAALTLLLTDDECWMNFDL